MRERKYLEFRLRQEDEPFLERLPLPQSESIRLLHSGLTYNAAAAQLNIPLNTLRTRVHRGRVSVIAMRAVAAQQQEEANGA